MLLINYLKEMGLPNTRINAHGEVSNAFLMLKTGNMNVNQLEPLLKSHKEELALVEITPKNSNTFTLN